MTELKNSGAVLDAIFAKDFATAERLSLEDYHQVADQYRLGDDPKALHDAAYSALFARQARLTEGTGWPLPNWGRT